MEADATGEPHASETELGKRLANLAALLAVSSLDGTGPRRVETNCLTGSAVVHVDAEAVDVVLHPGDGSSLPDVLTVHVRHATGTDRRR